MNATEKLTKLNQLTATKFDREYKRLTALTLDQASQVLAEYKAVYGDDFVVSIVTVAKLRAKTAALAELAEQGIEIVGA